MNLSNIETFLEIEKTRNITRASQNLFLTQSTVSQRLKQLEDEIGVQLIIRQKGMRNIELTKKGEAFIPIAQRWTSLHNETIQLREYPEISLRIGTVESIVSSIFPPFIKQLSSHSPPIDLNVRIYQSQELYRLVGNKELDIGIVSYEADFNDIVVEPIFTQKMCVIKYSDNPLKGQSIHPRCLDSVDELFMDWGPEVTKWHDKWWGPAKYPRITTDSCFLMAYLLENTDRWALASTSNAKFLAGNGKIQIFTLEEPPPDRIVYKIVHRDPNPNNISGIRLFEAQLTKYIVETDLLSLENI